jgi:hypothetical protein
MNDSSTRKRKVRDLRKQGLSYRTIASDQKLPLSTVHLWSKDIELTQKQKNVIQESHKQAFEQGRKIGQQKKHEKYVQQKEKFYAEGYAEINKLSEKEKNLIGIALYWGEGFKKDSRFGFANSDPKMIIFILNWLYQSFGISKEDVRLRLGLNVALQERTEVIQQQWSDITQVPIKQFQKPFYQKTSQNKQYTNTEKYLGVLRIRVNNHPELLPTIMGMIDKLQ